MCPRLKSPKFPAYFMVCVAVLYVITIFALDGKISHPPPPPASSWKFTFDNVQHVLRYMGYPSIRVSSKRDKAQLESFFSSVSLFAISSAERQIYIELLGQFQAFCRQNNITFFLFYGAMLGAFRHHGLVPWDDDLDVLVPLSSKSKCEKLLKNHPVLAYGRKGKFVSPVFLKDEKKSQPIKKRKWRWPYLEVHFYETKNERMVHHFMTCGASKVSDIFPLIEVPFENMTMPAPRRMDCLVVDCYTGSETSCCTQWYGHKEEKNAQNGTRCIGCKLLKSVFPFVSSRHRRGEYVTERVFLNGTKVRTRWVKKPVCRTR